jgi:hypothetical protein
VGPSKIPIGGERPSIEKWAQFVQEMDPSKWKYYGIDLSGPEMVTEEKRVMDAGRAAGVALHCEVRDDIADCDADKRECVYPYQGRALRCRATPTKTRDDNFVKQLLACKATPTCRQVKYYVPGDFYDAEEVDKARWSVADASKAGGALSTSCVLSYFGGADLTCTAIVRF